MTDRPRVYSAIRVRHYGGGETSFAKPVTLIEWNREKVLSVMTAAIRAYDEDSDGEWTAEGTARAIYGTLDHD